MKKIVAILLPLTLLVSSVSCSQNSNNSSSAVSGQTAESSAETVAPDAGTGYTKGVSNDGVYVNEYAKIKINIPENLRVSSDKEVEDLGASSLTYYLDEKNHAFESGIIWDSWFASDMENMIIRFVNTKIAFPDKADASAEDVLEIFRERNEGSGVKYEDRTTVTLSGEEYLREVYSFEAGEFEPPYFNYMYTRKIDDDLVCLISVASTSTDSTPEKFEGMFE